MYLLHVYDLAFMYTLVHTAVLPQIGVVEVQYLGTDQ
jgi:hypothetical protein